LGYYSLALFLMFLMGIFNSTYMISIQSSLQMLVPDQMRGRVMGFYGMTWSIMPLSGMQAGALANFIGTTFAVPLAVMIGGLAVAAFALGPALLNSKVRNLGATLHQLERAATDTAASRQPSA
jgi:MFS family permease